MKRFLLRWGLGLLALEIAILAIIATGFLGFWIASAAATAPAPLRIVALGTSLTAGYNLPPGSDFIALTERELRALGHDVVIVNAGVSGDTSAGGLARLDWALAEGADGLIVELGSNDMLRGLDPAQTEANLDAIVAEARRRGIAVLILGMLAQRNLGAEYAQAFDPIFGHLAEHHEALLMPFVLDGVALDPALNQADGIHPNEAGAAVIAENLLPHLEALIARIEAMRASPPA